MIFSKTLIVALLIGSFGAIGALIRKNVLHVFQPLEFLMMTFGFDTIFMFLFILLSGNVKARLHNIKSKLTLSHIVSIISFSLLITALSFGMLWLTKRKHISKINPIIAIISTLLTFLGGVFVLGEPVSTKDYFAMLLMVIGIAIIGYD